MVIFVAVIILFFGSIHLYISALARTEQTALRSNTFEVQKIINENMSGDFEMGLQLVDELLVENDFFNQKIMYEVLDQVISNTEKENLLAVLTAFMKSDIGTLNIYELKTGKLLHTIGSDPFYIPQPSLSRSKKELKPGNYHVLDDPFSSVTSGEGRHKLYYYYSKSQPWMMVIKRPYLEQTGPKNSAKRMVAENLNQVNKYLHYELMVIDSSSKVIKASDAQLVGSVISQIEIVSNQDKRISKDQLLHNFKLTVGKGESKKYTGIISALDGNKIVFATDVVRFEEENNRILRWLHLLLVLNVIIATFCVLLMLKNYLYFNETEPEGSSRL